MRRSEVTWPVRRKRIMRMTRERKNDCKTAEINASTLNVSVVWPSVCGFLSVFEVKNFYMNIIHCHDSFFFPHKRIKSAFSQ